MIETKTDADNLYGNYQEDKDPNEILDVTTPPKKGFTRRAFDFLCLKVDEIYGIRYNPIFVDSEYDVRSNDRYILAAGTFTINLPDGINGKEITIKNVGSGTITVSSGEFIDLTLTSLLSNQNDWITVVYTNDPTYYGWIIVSKT